MSRTLFEKPRRARATRIAAEEVAVSFRSSRSPRR